MTSREYALFWNQTIRVEREKREKKETEKVTFVLIKYTKENKDFLGIENEKKSSCKEQLIKRKHL